MAFRRSALVVWLQPGDPRGTARDLPFAVGFYLEWEKWARQDLVDGLVVLAPFEGGVAEALVLDSRVCGLVVCGICMMDPEWPSNQCLHEWLDRVGDRTIGRVCP